ncbi:hypothetical protein LOTGIDRAFT_115607, partial [Lottia gigantea]
RSSTASVYPGTAVVGLMIPRNPGKYGVNSMAEDNFGEGMSASLNVENCFRANASLPTPTKERNYYLSIEERTWNYGPSGFDEMIKTTLAQPGSPSALFFDSANGLGGNYKKMEYIQYTDDSYGQKANRTPNEQHLGLLGPPLRVEEGETVNLMLRNKGNKKYSFVGQSLYYNPSDSGYSGVLYPSFTHTYKFQVPENIVQADDPNCVVRLYYSADDFPGDVNEGLIGPLLICRSGTLNANNKPINFTREFFLLFKNFDESKTSLFQSNIKEFATNQSVDQFNSRFQLSNKRQSINGYSYGNLPMLAMCQGENVILYMMTLGNSDEDVSVHFHGNRLEERKITRDTVGLISGMTKTMTMKPEALGIWGIVSTIQEQYLMGMTGRYSVNTCTPAFGSTRGPTPTAMPQTPTGINSPTRRYAIGAVEVDWDYAAKERDLFNGVDLNDPRADANAYIKNDQSYIGSVYKKAVFRGFADTAFKQQINRGFDVSHLGILGPVIKAEVGENIEIFFKNLVNSTRKFSIQPHGVQLDKDNEEFFYEDGQRYQPLVGVAFDQAKIYKWSVPASAGPGPKDPNCITWLYYSAVDKIRDVESGLIGPLQICRKGTLNVYGQRQDVNREFHLLFKKFNENQSWFLDANILSSAPGRVGTDFPSDSSFEESNKMFSINGESNGNLKGLAMLEKETVAWNFYAIGDNEAFKTVRVNGNTFTRPSEHNERADAMELYPGTSESVIMEANNAGKWLITSDVSTHVTKGMSATYQVIRPR